MKYFTCKKCGMPSDDGSPWVGMCMACCIEDDEQNNSDKSRKASKSTESKKLFGIMNSRVTKSGSFL